MSDRDVILRTVVQAPDLASVAVARPVRGLFTYLVPAPLAGSLEPGRRVVVPFGAGRAVGFYLGKAASAPKGPLKAISSALDVGPLLSSHMLAFLGWVSDYYRYPLGEALRTALPPGLAQPRQAPAERRDVVVWVSLAKPDAPPARGIAMRAVVDYLRTCGRVSLEELAAAIPGARDPVKRLAALGIVSVEEVQRERQELPRALAGTRPQRLSDEQEVALAAVLEAARSRRFEPFLLQGVTGSGKTEVYLRAIEEIRRANLTALCLVPEIALTPQLVARFRARFEDDVAVLHSGLRDKERLAEWRRLKDGSCGIAVGVRSAIFAPVENLGIVVVDEEHDSSFKQAEMLRYNARDLAVVRAKMVGAPVVLGSATPSLESLHNARTGRYRHLRLTRRIDDRPLPTVTIVDMRIESPSKGLLAVVPGLAPDAASLGTSGVATPSEPAADPGKAVFPMAAEARDSGRAPRPERPLLSAGLTQALAEVLRRGQQAMLLLNRRGRTTFHLCATCGLVLRCPSCSVALTYHLSRRSLLCHYCGYTRGLPETCAECQGEIVQFGVGTERVVEEVCSLFPAARVDRLDRDAASEPSEITGVLTRFAAGEIDILVGTQMLAKGHDFAGVTLVGVVLADTALHLPDFRAAEFTFQLLTQVAGRAGRGDAPGRVLVQTYNPETVAIARVVGHDYDGFADAELTRRQALFFPPFARLLAARVEGVDPGRTMQGARRLAEAAGVAVRGSRGALRLLGPAPAPIARLRGKSRWQLLVKGPTSGSLKPVAEAIEATMKGLPPGIRAVLDVDPMDLL